MASASMRTLADLLNRGGVRPDRMRFSPPPGTAAVADVEHIQAHEDRLCELVEGVLLARTVAVYTSADRASVLGRPTFWTEVPHCPASKCH